MTSVVSKNIQIYNAKQFKESVSEPASSNVYLTFGRVRAWDDDNNPPQANTSIASFFEVWDNMIGGKRITGNEIRHVVPRFDWLENTVYYAYDDLTDSNELKNGVNQFYVVTDSFNVYKCLANNYGAASTVKPTSVITGTDFQTADGYLWKYMYTLDAEEQLRFLTSDYMPVKTLIADDNSTQWQVQDNAIEGGIHSIILSNHGDNYTANDITISITGDGTGANAYAVRNVTTNVISSIVVNVKGAGYTKANVTISSPTGANAVGRIIISPTGGHGSDPLVELGGSYLILNPKISSDEGGILTVANDFRQISFIEEPLIYGTKRIVGNTVFNQLTVCSLTGTSVDFKEDEYVYQGSSLANAAFKGVVVEWDETNNLIKLSNVQGEPINDLLYGTESAASRFLDSVTYPDLKSYSGKLLYINNIEPIERAINQAENFQIVLKF